jgi:hypothetical protein
LPYYQKSQDFVFEQNTRSALTGHLVEKLIRNSRCVKISSFIQKQYRQITSRWNKLEIPRPLPIIDITQVIAANHFLQQAIMMVALNYGDWKKMVLSIQILKNFY